MPELPEVETIVRDIRPRLVGRTIGRASLSHDDVLRGVTKRKLLGALAGALLQTLTFVIGIKALLLIVAALYLAALFTRPTARR